MNVNSKEERRKRIANFREDAVRIAQKHLFGPLASLAEDAAQASLLKALEKESTYKGNMDKFEGWLYSIVRNTCKDMGRKKREVLTPLGELSNLPANTTTNSNSFSEKTEKLKRLKTVVQSLPVKDRKLIMSRVYFNLSGKETAQFLNMPTKNVNVNYMRAKTKLKNRYVSLENIDKKK
jgi:RNA polymerase sigma factor (sigma-70 family)